MKIRFLNHASFILEYKNFKILTDPYLYGDAFNEGWRLIKEFDHQKYLSNLTHIYFSHEHPDHFSVPFLKSIPKEERNKITIIFQKTFDKRVRSFCEKLGYSFLECENCILYQIDNNLKFIVGKVPFYDSWINFNIEDKNILNVNDCVLERPEVVNKIRSVISNKIDILFTQFSYAGYAEKSEQKKLANSVLKKIKLQDKILKPSYLVPFASLIYFSHVENKFMNENINNMDTVYNFIKENCEADPLILKPNDILDIDKNDNLKNLNFWRQYYLNINQLEFRENARTFNTDTLILKSEIYISNLKKKNNFYLIKLLYKIGFFSDVKIYVKDLKKKYSFNVVNGLRVINNDEHLTNDYLKLSSDSLAYIFDFDFGFDTLIINSRFSIDNKFISHITRNFMLGSIMNTGRYIKFSNLFKFVDITMLLRGFKKIF